MNNLSKLTKSAMALHGFKSIGRMSDDPTDHWLYNEREITCICGVFCAEDEIDDPGELPRFSDHVAEAVAEIIDKELFATVNEAALRLARVALREHSGMADEKLEAGVKGYLFALRHREPRAEFGESFYSYPSVNDLRNHMRVLRP